MARNSIIEAVATHCGDRQSADFNRLYAQLRRLAHRELGAAPRAMLCTTALVHEAWIKLEAAQPDGAARESDSGRIHLALAARVMRNVLIDYVRERNAAKRGGGLRALTLDTGSALATGGQSVDLMIVEQGLQALDEVDPRLVSVVECHFFAGMAFTEIGKLLELSERTVQRDWRRARAFLQVRLADESVS